MTVKEAIRIDDEFNRTGLVDVINFKEYREKAREALEKQMPKEPIERIATQPVKIGNGFFSKGVKVHTCPHCKGLIARVHECCYHCGQKLDWSKNNA